MSAQILAASTPYVMQAQPDGSFQFDDVQAGAYTLTIYAGAQKVERRVEVSGPRTEIGF
jgi:hypothetical protein